MPKSTHLYWRSYALHHTNQPFLLVFGTLLYFYGPWLGITMYVPIIVNKYEKQLLLFISSFVFLHPRMVIFLAPVIVLFALIEGALILS